MLILLVIGVAVFTQAAVGFGQALIAMPLITLLTNPQTATPLIALVGAVSTLLILLHNRREINVRESWRLIIASCVGLPFGVYLLTRAPEALITGLLGVMLMSFGLYNLANFTLPAIKHHRLSYGFGFVSGLLSGAYNTSGPPLIIYGVMRRWTAQEFPATLQSVFVTNSVFVLIAHGLAGLWTPTVTGLFGYSIPVVVLAAVLGFRFNRMLSPEQFGRIIYSFLVVIGVLLLLT